MMAFIQFFSPSRIFLFPFPGLKADQAFNSLLPVGRYIDTAFADKGSHQKKNLQPKCPDTSKFGLLGKQAVRKQLG